MNGPVSAAIEPPKRDTFITSAEYLADRIMCLECNMETLVGKVLGGGRGETACDIPVDSTPPMIQHNKIMSSKIEDMINRIQEVNEVLG